MSPYDDIMMMMMTMIMEYSSVFYSFLHESQIPVCLTWTSDFKKTGFDFHLKAFDGHVAWSLLDEVSQLAGLKKGLPISFQCQGLSKTENIN